MEILSDPSTLVAGDVLYHAALGFAVVQGVDDAVVSVTWEAGGRHHPGNITRSTMTRGYLLCPEGGFFARSIHARSALRALLLDRPLEGLGLLLKDLQHPLRRRDVEDWFVRRDLLDSRFFETWWQGVWEAAPEDARFRFRGEWISLADAEPPPPLADMAHTLADEDMPPSTRAERFVASNAPRRTSLLEGVHEGEQRAFLGRLLSLGDVEGMEQALGSLGWAPGPLPPEVLDDMEVQVQRGSRWELTLARVLTRLDPERAADALSPWAATAAGQKNLSTFVTTLPPDLADCLAPLLAARLADSGSLPGPVRGFLGLGAPPALSPGRPPSQSSGPSEDALAELTASLEPAEGTEAPGGTDTPLQPLTGLAPWPASSWPDLAVSLARALGRVHARGRRLGPELQSLKASPSGRISLDDFLGSPADTARDEDFQADIQDAAWMLVDLGVGPLPDRERMTLQTLLSVVNGTGREPLPPALLGTLSACVSPRPCRGSRVDAVDDRPAHGVDLWCRMERAAAVERLRREVPFLPGATVEAACDTHVGRHKLHLGIPNQDAVLCAVGTGGAGRASEPMGPAAASFFAVCDGISQCTVGSGDLASTIAMRMLGTQWERQRERVMRGGPAAARAFLDESLEMANRAVCAAVLQLTRGVLLPGTSMGTTVVACVVVGNHAQIATLGDSRAYLVGDWGVTLLTADQNLDLHRFQSAQRGEPVSWDGPGKGLVGFLGHFGMEGHPSLLPVAHRGLSLLPGERLVLCSDGLTDYLGSDEGTVRASIGRLVRDTPPGEAVTDLIQAANRGGGGDNVTAVVVRAGPLWRAPLRGAGFFLEDEGGGGG